MPQGLKSSEHYDFRLPCFLAAKLDSLPASWLSSLPACQLSSLLACQPWTMSYFEL
jgi:hypothetical protein